MYTSNGFETNKNMMAYLKLIIEYFSNFVAIYSNFDQLKA